MESVEKAVAKSLLEIKAVLLRPETPFTWASGWKSPIYCDNRKILSYPLIRENVCRWMADIIRKQYPDAEIFEIQGADKVHTLLKSNHGEEYVV
jgi:orotate phosphoribosyltransferase